MRKVFISIIISAITMVQASYADDVSRRALAEELLTLMEVQKTMEESFEMVKEMQVTQLQQMELSDEESSEKAQLMTQKMVDMISKEMSWDKLKDDYIGIYADTFTEEELKGIINFYKSPVGQKFIEKTPELMRKSMEVSQRQMRELMPKIQSMTEEMEEKWEEEKNQESFFDE